VLEFDSERRELLRPSVLIVEALPEVGAERNSEALRGCGIPLPNLASKSHSDRDCAHGAGVSRSGWRMFICRG